MKILITAGPTREAIDMVRFITNRSSGKMGYALARAAKDNGWDTVLISGPVNLPPPEGVDCIMVESAKRASYHLREKPVQLPMVRASLKE